MSGTEKWTRRRFVRSVATATAGVAAGIGAGRCKSAGTRRNAPTPAEESTPRLAGVHAPPTAQSERQADGTRDDAAPTTPQQRATVVLVRDRGAVDEDGGIVAGVVARMLDDAVTALTGEQDPAAAWRTLVTPDDVVGVKSNEWEPLPTPHAVETAIRGRLVEAGVAPERIRIDDRGARTTLAGCTALVNVRPVRSHHWAGIGGCIKNYIIFAEQPDVYHPDACADLGAVWKLPIVAGKTRINFLLAFTPLFFGRGPHHFDRRYVWPYRGLFASRDPVAADSLGARLLQLKRIDHFGGERPLTPHHHVALAETRHGIGVADPDRIDLVRLGWTAEDLLNDR